MSKHRRSEWYAPDGYKGDVPGLMRLQDHRAHDHTKYWDFERAVDKLAGMKFQWVRETNDAMKARVRCPQGWSGEVVQYNLKVAAAATGVVIKHEDYSQWVTSGEEHEVDGLWVRWWGFDLE